MKGWGLVIVLVGNLLWASGAWAAQKTLTPTFADALIISQSNYGNFASHQYLAIFNTEGRVNWSLLKFRLGVPLDLPANVNIDKAILQVWLDDMNMLGICAGKVFRITQDWRETEVTWGNKPSSSTPTTITSFTFANENKYIAWDVTTLVKGWVDGTYPNYGLYLKDASGGSSGSCSALFYSREGPADKRPKLVIDYSPKPTVAVFQAAPNRITFTLAQDTTPPVITGFDIRPSNITHNSAIITWGTNEESEDIVYYSPTTQRLGLGQSAAVVGFYTNHTIFLKKLTPSTTYTFSIKSKDRAGNAVIKTYPNFRFTTREPTPPQLESSPCIDPATRRERIAVQNVRTLNPTYNQVDITWETAMCGSDPDRWSSYPTFYKVYFKINGTAGTQVGSYNFIFPDNSREPSAYHAIRVRPLLRETNYSYRIEAYDNAGRRMVSSPYYFATTAPMPAPPDNPSATPTPTPSPSANPTINQVSSITPDNIGSDEIVTDEPTAEIISPPPSPPETDEAVLSPTVKRPEPPAVLPTSGVAFGSPFWSLFQSATDSAGASQKLTTDWRLLLLIIVVILALIGWLIWWWKKRKQVEVVKKSWWKKIILIVVLLAAIKLGLDAWPFLSMLPFGDETRLDDRVSVVNRPVLQIPVKEVPVGIKNAKFDCQTYPLLPDKNKKYLCQNIYQTNEDDLKNLADRENPERVMLYGQYIYFDCSPSPTAGSKEPVKECYRLAHFLDNFQIERMAEVLGVDAPREKIYYYATTTMAKTQQLCSSEAGGCIRYDTNQIVFPLTAIRGSYFVGEGVFSFFERYATTDPNPITYKAKGVIPEGCYLEDNHEIIHLLTYGAGIRVPTWLEEGLIWLMSETMRRQLCPPGLQISDISREENGQTTRVEEKLTPDSFDLDLPISGKLVTISEDNKCRQVIFSQIARNINEGGTYYVKQLYRSLSKKKLTTENQIAKLVWESSGEPTSVKDYLNQNGCTVD